MDISNDSNKQGSDTQDTESGSSSEMKDLKKRWIDYLKNTLWIIGIAVFVYIVWEDARNYYPDQWFKPNFVIHSDLSEIEMNAVNDLYAYVKKESQNSYGYGYYKNSSFLKDLHPALKKFSRRSLIKLNQDIASVVRQENSASPRYLRDDYFLKYSRKIEFVEWFVYDNGWNDGTKPQYLLKYSIRNLTDCYIDKMVIRVYSEKQDSISVYSGRKELRPVYDKEFSLVPADPMQPKHYQQYICAIREDDFSYINRHTVYGEIKLVYIK